MVRFDDQALRDLRGIGGSTARWITEQLLRLPESPIGSFPEVLGTERARSARQDPYAAMFEVEDGRYVVRRVVLQSELDAAVRRKMEEARLRDERIQTEEQGRGPA